MLYYNALRCERQGSGEIMKRTTTIGPSSVKRRTANLRIKILDFRGGDSNIIFSLRGGILMSIGNFPESLSQAILVGMILVGRLGVRQSFHKKNSFHKKPQPRIILIERGHDAVGNPHRAQISQF